jgi:hypothetical protein
MDARTSAGLKTGDPFWPLPNHAITVLVLMGRINRRKNKGAPRAGHPNSETASHGQRARVCHRRNLASFRFPSEKKQPAPATKHLLGYQQFSATARILPTGPSRLCRLVFGVSGRDRWAGLSQQHRAAAEFPGSQPCDF